MVQFERAIPTTGLKYFGDLITVGEIIDLSEGLKHFYPCSNGIVFGILEVIECRSVQHCMSCYGHFPDHELEWISDVYGIPFKKVCVECVESVEDYLDNLGRYDSSCPIDPEY